MRRALIAGNWKMNLGLEEGMVLVQSLLNQSSAEDFANCDVLVCPQMPLIAPLADIAGNIKIGAQDCGATDSGAFTGDTSPQLLASLGCDYVIVGHSERRAGRFEDDGLIQAKAGAAQKAGLTAIVCVGESEMERELGNAETIVASQLAGSIPEGSNAENLVVAYEPVWAIGTGKTASEADVQEMHASIRDQLEDLLGDASKIRILYGGSVKADNAKALLALKDVDGALVGGASLKAESFMPIIKATK